MKKIPPVPIPPPDPPAGSVPRYLASGQPFGWFNRRKEKEKSKRNSERLALYRDWPPYLVDTFIRWEQLKVLDADFYSDSPKGYLAWQNGIAYKDYLEDDPYKGVVLRRR